MIQLCFVIENQLYQMNIDRAGGTYYTPLSVWESVQVNHDCLSLPENWKVAETQSMTIPLLREANYTLSNGKQEIFMMVRNIEPDELISTTVMIGEHFTVGRSHRNELCYRDGFMSTIHGVFHLSREGSLLYEDASTNGTFINGKKLHRASCCLKSGDQIDFPPLCRVIADSSVLHIRHSFAHGMINLPKMQEMEEDMIHVALYFQTAGSLRHVALQRSVTTWSELLKQVKGQLSDQDLACLRSSPVLFERRNESLRKMDKPFEFAAHLVYIVP